MGKGGNGVWYPVLLILATNFHWSISGDGEWKYEERELTPQAGQKLELVGFYGYQVVRIERDKITIDNYGTIYELVKGQTL